MAALIVLLHRTGTRKAKPKQGDNAPKDYVDIWRGMRRSIVRARARSQQLLARNPAYFREG